MSKETKWIKIYIWWWEYEMYSRLIRRIMKIKGIETASILPWYRVIIMNSITIDIQKLTLVKMSYGFISFYDY